MSSDSFPSGFRKIDFHHYYQTTPCPRGRMRCLAMLHLQKGKTIKEVAEIIQQSRVSIHTWLNWLRKEGGLDHLIGFVKGRGRKSKVSSLDDEQIRVTIDKLREERQGGRITAKDIQQMFQEKWDVFYSLSGLYRLLKRLGIVWIASVSASPGRSASSGRVQKKTSPPW